MWRDDICDGDYSMGDVMKVTLVEPEKVPHLWPLIGKQVDLAIQGMRGLVNEAQLYESFVTGFFQLWLVHDGDTPMAIVGTQIETFPQMKICHIVAAGGESRKKWLHLRDDIEVWARSIGCARMMVTTRDGWARDLNEYKKVAVVLEKKL